MVSVIVPAYNAENFIERCINSVVGQTYHDLELIIVDDGSTDNTLDIGRQFSIKDTRIVLLHKENEGTEKAREYGLRHTRGEFIIFVDADDYLSEDALETVVNSSEKTEADIVCFGYESNGKPGFSGGDELNLDSDQALANMLIRHRLDGNLTSKLYKAALLKKDNVTFESKRNCDFLTCAQIIRNAEKITVIPYIGYHYSFIVGSQSKNIRCNVKEEQYEVEAKRFLDNIDSRKSAILPAAEFNWLNALLYVNIKFEKDRLIHRSNQRMKTEKRKLRQNRRAFLHNPYFKTKDKIQYWMCYLNMFRSIYTGYRILRGIRYQ